MSFNPNGREEDLRAQPPALTYTGATRAGCSAHSFTRMPPPEPTSLVVLVRRSSGVVPGDGIGGVEPTSAVESPVGTTARPPGGQDRVLVLSIAGQIDRETPAMGRAQIAQRQRQHRVVGERAIEVSERASESGIDATQR